MRRVVAAAVIIVVGAAAGVVLSVGPTVASPFGGGGTQDVSVTNEIVARLSEPVAIDAASLETLTNATALGNCTYKQGDPSTTIGGTPTVVPASSMANRTAVTVFNESVAIAEILICANDGTPPSATHGVKLRNGGQFRKWEGAQAGWAVSCICATGTCTVGVEEEQCYQ